ncbi:MAG: spore cortex biosynthesis protein YabQ [Clostridia bacterium]|nr:spore cortex biosynthesis protein YabQ [Clostridia bacterium]
MGLQKETITFLTFVLVGIIYGVIFDFFRALRKVKKRKDIVVCMQDIIYFIIVGIILIFAMYIHMKEKLRVYLLLSIILGIVIYVSIVGNKLVKLFTELMKTFNNIISFIFLPLDIFRQLFSKQITFFKKIANNCCKRICYVINFNYSKLMQKKNKLKTKEGKLCQGQECQKKLKRKRRLN